MADSGTTILNLTPTAALLDTDVIPVARPSGTTAPGTDLGLTGKALKALLVPTAPLYASTGTATDGAMTQAATTAALAYVNFGVIGDRNVSQPGGFVQNLPVGGTDNFFAPAFTNTYGTGLVNNRFGLLATNNKYGNGMQNCVFGANLKTSTFGINLLNCRVGDNCTSIIIGDNCQRVEVYNSNTLTIPAGTTDAVYRNNALVGPAFTPVTANQYGTHPAFTSQSALNAYLLGGTAPPPPPTVSNASFTAA